MSKRASFLARALSAAITLLVTPFAFATVTADLLPLLVAVTAGLFFEAMSHAGYLSPAALDMVERFLLPEPHHSWLYMENEEAKCIVGTYERKEISATWANLNISRIVWNAKHNRGTCAVERKRERVPGTCRDEQKELDDLCRALDRLDRPPRPPRPDPPVMQTPPEYVLRYPAPEAMRKIRARRLHFQQDNLAGQSWPDSRGSVAAAVHLPTNGHGRF